jgi:hypothetical protein
MVFGILPVIFISALANAFLAVCFYGFHEALHERPSYQNSRRETGFGTEPSSAMCYQPGETAEKPAAKLEAA